MICDGLLKAAVELGLRPLQRGLDEDPHDRVDHPEVPLLLHVPAKLRVDHPLKSAINSSVCQVIMASGIPSCAAAKFLGK